MKKILCVLLVFACITGILFAAGASEAKSAQVVEISTNVTEDASIEAATAMYEQLISEYNAQNGTNYQLRLLTGQKMDIINTRMSSDDKPDLFIIDSPADVFNYAKDGLLYDLTEYSEKYGWEDKMFDWAYALSISNGQVVTVPFGYEGLVMWYNKAIMKELGLEADKITDLASFEAALQKAQDAGYVPIIFGSQDDPEAQEWYLSIMYSYAGRDLLKETLEGTSETGWLDPRFQNAVELYKSWNDKGYLADGKSYILTSDDTINTFTAGKALFKMEGTWAPWWILSLSEEEQENIGVMLHPAINDTEIPHMPLAIGGNWCVSATTENADICAYILDGSMRQEFQGPMLEGGMDVAPIKIDDEQFQNLPPVVQEMWKMVNGALDEGAFGYATYAFYPPQTRVYSYEGIINVFLNKISIEDYLTEMQRLNQKELAEGFVPIIPAVSK